MKLILVFGILISFLMLTNISGYTPGPYEPVVDPGLVVDPGIVGEIMVLPCTCEVGDTQDGGCADINGCEAHKVCNAGLCSTSDDCGDMGCAFARLTCEQDCDDDYSLCTAACGGSIFCGKSCLGTKNSCYDDCNDSYNSCVACDGVWSSCQKVNLCCMVQCAMGTTCNPDNGACECPNDEELCGADGTGDGVDDDCDGDIDETCGTCAVDATVACTDDGCPGVQTCGSDNEWEDCVKNNPCCGVDCEGNELCNPSTGNCDCKMETEICGNNYDDNCDGDIDEDCDDDSTDNASDASDDGTGDTGNLPPNVVANIQVCLDKGGTCVDQCVGCAPEYMDVCDDGYEIDGICKPQKEGVVGGTKQVCCVPSSTGGSTDSSTTGASDTTGTQTKPIETKPLDTNLFMILLAIIIIGVLILVGVKMMKGKGKGAPIAPPTPPVQPAQPPQ